MLFYTVPQSKHRTIVSEVTRRLRFFFFFFRFLQDFLFVFFGKTRLQVCVVLIFSTVQELERLTPFAPHAHVTHALFTHSTPSAPLGAGRNTAEASLELAGSEEVRRFLSYKHLELQQPSLKPPLLSCEVSPLLLHFFLTSPHLTRSRCASTRSSQLPVRDRRQRARADHVGREEYELQQKSVRASSQRGGKRSSRG